MTNTNEAAVEALARVIAEALDESADLWVEYSAVARHGLEAASSHMAVEGVVRKLEWTGEIAVGVTGRYSIRKIDGDWRCLHNGLTVGWYDTLDDAKVGANKDYAKRILSALEPVASPPPLGTQAPLPVGDEIIDALIEARNQIEYLHGKFSETGSGNAVMAHLDFIRRKLQSEATPPEQQNAQ